MPDDRHVLDLLEEALDSGRTPEQVCADRPELLPAVRARWERCRRLDAQLEALFPSFGSTRGVNDGDWPDGAHGAPGSPHAERAPGARERLPSIPGYAVEGILGRGGVGVVYRARHLGLRRPVALKMLLSGVYAGPVERARFLQEARAVAALRHAHVVQVHDVGEFDGRPYFTMELMDGGSLAERLRGVPQPPDEAAALVVAIAGAIEAAHRAGIIHRDLKPANVLLTADGIPKVSDFGLARQATGDGGDADCDAALSLTLSGARMGTPSYMAPEQAAGRRGGTGPATDVYALGAVLYEMLTGRPPFRGESAAETERQVIAQEPVAPSRLNPRVPRDLETICLKCLRKEPERRYASAAELADDLTRFREGRPILARPPSAVGRVWRWGRREPAKAALLAVSLALAGVAIGGGYWLDRQQAIERAETARQEGRTWQTVAVALGQASALEDQGRWPEAKAVLAGAPSLQDDSAPPLLRGQLTRARRDAAMVVGLEEIRLRSSEGRRPRDPGPTTDQLYTQAFLEYGIPLTTDLDPAEAARRVRTSDISQTLAVYLHDWAFYASDANRARVRAVVEQADEDPWRREVRRAAAGNDAVRLKQLSAAPAAAAQPPVVLSGLTNLLLAAGAREAARSLLCGAQQRHPGDFWINFQLGEFLQQEHPAEAAGYFRAAVALRPQNDPAYTLLGRTLRDARDLDGAIAAFRRAVELNPDRGGTRDLAGALAEKGQLEEARVSWEKVLSRDPPDQEAWYGYAQLCLYLDNEDAYARTRKAMLARFGDTDDWVIAERTSLACMLRPASGEELQRIVRLTKRTAQLGPKPPEPDNRYIQFVQGLSEYRQGHFKEAIPLLHEAATELPNRAGPRVALAMAQFRSGSEKEARESLALAVRTANWKESHGVHPTIWVNHVLRREAEALMLPNLPAFLRGEYRPSDNDERVAFLAACQFQERYAAAVRLYAEAFAADPALANDAVAECARRAATESQPNDRTEVLNTECRYLAARCAALAGCGKGRDAVKPDDAGRARWRKQARDWLQADLAGWKKTLEDGDPASRDLVNRMLTGWQEEPDLAGVRDADALKNLPAGERDEWNAFWKEVLLASRNTQ